MSEAQQRAFALADNKLTLCSTWDEKLLGEQLKHLSELNLDFDLSVLGFENPEIDLLIQALDLSGEDAEEIPTVDRNGRAVTQVGDLWKLGSHRLYCGDSLQANSYEVLLEGHRADLVFTDPPWNVAINGHVLSKSNKRHDEFVQASGEMSDEEFVQFLDSAIERIKAVCADGGLLYVCMDFRGLHALTCATRKHGLEQKNLVVWDKGVGAMGSFYRSQHELIMVLKHGHAKHTNNIQLGRFGRNRTNLWAYKGMTTGRITEEGNLLEFHPTPKPVAMVADALLDASERGQIVLDAFMGSGTTIMAAEKTGRLAYGIELDPKYVDVAVQRWQRKTGQQAIHAVTGETFDSRVVQTGSVEEGV